MHPSTHPSPAEAAAVLQLRPDEFVARCVLNLVSDPHDPSCLHTPYYLGYQHGDLALEYWRITMAAEPLFIAPDPPPTMMVINFIGLTPIQSIMNGTGLIPPFVLPPPSVPGPRLTLTTLLTGCTFCFLPCVDGSMLCAHVKPGIMAEWGFSNARDVHDRLRDRGHFDGYEAYPIFTFGPLDYDHMTHTANVVLAAGQDGWRVYTQSVLRYPDEHLTAAGLFYPTV